MLTKLDLWVIVWEPSSGDPKNRRYVKNERPDHLKGFYFLSYIPTDCTLFMNEFWVDYHMKQLVELSEKMPDNVQDRMRWEGNIYYPGHFKKVQLSE